MGAIVQVLRTLFTLAIAGVVALFAAGSIAPPPEEPVHIVGEPREEVRMGDQSTAPDTPPELELAPAEPQPSPGHTDPETNRTRKTTEGAVRAIPTSPPPPATPQKLSFSIIDIQTRGAVVHLLCTTRTNRSVRVTTGSGVVIDPRGIVLTNAHVAQFWLLPKENPLGETECSVRSAFPIDQRYAAEILYFPRTWVFEHAEDIDNPNPKGTGEHDYAFLRITKPLESDILLPNIFPFASYTTDDDIERGDNILVAAYPATDVSADAAALRNLSIVSTRATIEDIFTFNRTTLDLVALGGTILSFKGSSGGAVVDDDNRLIAIVATSTTGDTPEERKLRAITLSHIDRSLREHTGLGFSSLLSGDLEAKADTFNRLSAPALTTKLLSELE